MRDAAFARAVIDGERFMTLATADADGRPWGSPVWFAHDRYRDFFWVSRPVARHSRNIEARPQIGIVIFDSGQTPGDGRAVYMEASAGRSEHGLDVFNARSVEQGLEEFTEARVTGDAELRLYRATVSGWFVLEEERDVRFPVDLMPAPQRVRLLRSLYEAFNARDVDTCLAAMTPDVDWANGWEGGHVVGRDAVRDYWQRQWAVIDSTAEPTAVAERPDGSVEVAVHLLARDHDGNVVHDGHGRHVYEFRGDLVERMTIED